MQPRDNKRAALLPNATLDALDKDLIIRCASYLDADGLAQLGRTSAGFGIPQAGQQKSLVNEAAHHQFRQSATEDEKSRLPKYGDESDVGLYRALGLLRQPLRFDELVGIGFSPQENPESVVTHTCYYFSTAMSGHVMRGGRHFVEFAIKSSSINSIYLGVIRPIALTDGIDLEADWRGQVHPVFVSSSNRPAISAKWRSQRTAKWGDSNIHCCACYCHDGDCSWTDWNNGQVYSDWRGRGGMRGSGTIGLLLDLDEGTLSIFKNGRRLGVMKDGLDGEYCWFATVGMACMINMHKGEVPTEI